MYVLDPSGSSQPACKGLIILTCGIIKATKVGAVVGGQTSCKAPELAAFEKHLPKDVEIVSCHSLHGPKVNPKGQPLVGLQLQPIPISTKPKLLDPVQFRAGLVGAPNA